MAVPAERRPIVVVTGRHRPHEVLLLALSILVGVSYTIGAPPPTSVAALMPPWLVHTWAFGLLASGVIGLLSLIGGRGSLERRMRLELGSMLLGAAAILLSTEATFQYAIGVGRLGQALLSGGFGLAWAAANIVRAFQARQELRELRRMAREF